MKFESANDAMKSLAHVVLTQGKPSAPRGSGTLEVLGANFIISNPTARIITLPSRKFSLPLAIGELAWHLRGDDQVDALAYYAEAWRNFTDDGLHVSGSCYGRKLISVDSSGSSPWQRLVNLLHHDPFTRRATFGFITNEEDVEGSKDISCVSSIQFLVRENRLSLFTFMRSNDLFLGLPYDVFLFSYLQELMALELGLEMGEYHHYATSLHIYDQHRAACQRIAEDIPVGEGRSPRAGSKADFLQLAELEAAIRSGASIGPYNGPFNSYIDELLALRKRKDAKLASSGISTN
ncbi:thymidylate synthase [Agrobacterium tumefaciens]|jgi:thymidylate synthase|uniref:thymidylate synthase n=1 Tax=Agrobacterium tumefaciens complex TaxID=1183400 RepID=UPI000DCF95F4|nr:thymidylate synthase [Agrobacterium tumefaciens]MDP9857781.1 thymidylate synthase [Agrobacterium tumefaciens]